MASRQDAPSSSVSRKSGAQTIGQFDIDKEIGKGSFAQVYMGWHTKTKAAVAIKSVELARLNKKLKENLYGEIHILKALRHPHIVALHDCVESSTHINLVMEYCELGDLSLFIKKREKLITHPATHEMARKYPVAPNSGLHEVVIRHFLKQLSSALEFLRSKNYVHRDVKPQNLLLLPSRSFRDQRAFHIMSLADFGFARVLPSTSLADTLCGSPLYMAPEILRYERYDAKADLWSVGTVLYEMITGRPPFRARNHVELLRKIEAAEDVIKFPREVVISPELKALTRALLKRSPVERISFENFFTHPAVTSDIPGLVEDDVPKPVKRELERIPQGEPISSSPQSRPTRQVAPLSTAAREGGSSRSPRELMPRSPQVEGHGEGRPRRPTGDIHRTGNSPRDGMEGLGIQRPAPHHAASAPNYTQLAARAARDQVAAQGQLTPETRRPRAAPSSRQHAEEEKAAQDVMFERDYVVVERRHVEVNALADELAANERMASQGSAGHRASQMVRRSTQQGVPTSTTGADRRASYEKALSASPGSASSAITKAIQDASLRLFGFKMAPVRGAKGHSPPMYQPFPAYPTPIAPAGLLGDGKSSQSADEDIRAREAMEEYAERSDCVYGFAEVKYEQLVPMAPSMDRGLGGITAEQLADDGGLTAEAIVSLSEEALVLYVKSLTLLARAMDIASVWWSKKSRSATGSGVSTAVSEHVAQKINAIVQWVRQRFNEVLEKSEVVRLKLVEAQKLLPEDHPSHPSNHGQDSVASSSGSGFKQVYLTAGISAEKLMYDRALEMSRAAAIDEVTNENLPGCKISYVTAIRMLESVLEGDDDSTARMLSNGKEPVRAGSKENAGDLDMDEEAHVRKMIKMITGRLASVTKKQQMIAEANSKEQQAQLQMARRRSGDVTPRSVPTHGSS
ncbi:kinase [Hirsutella rhossiliensis]|uniref:non-specific serine/threonine protein kinase n=1 Tax=Hirsutella rhossiliensis TaxID=111463 RepID=A0A9P8MRH5_9HYPO|nr:kinase [Hirsutella rhossiliensis]KAH0959144.1 kinase [Hirsutella rhossiliensis]